MTIFRTALALRILAAASALVSASAYADYPLLADDAEVLEEGRCEAQWGVAPTRALEMPTATSQDAAVECGIGRNTQLSVQYLSSLQAGDQFESFAIKGKTSFTEADKGSIRWGLAYGINLSKEPGDVWKTVGYNASLLASRDFGRNFAAHANLGSTYDVESRQSATTWALGIETKTNVVLGLSVQGDDQNRPSWAIGARYKFTSRFSGNLTYVRSTDESQPQSLRLGGKYEF